MHKYLYICGSQNQTLLENIYQGPIIDMVNFGPSWFQATT